MAVVFPQQPRGPGRIQSGGTLVPANTSQNQVVLTAIMDDADRDDPSLTFTTGIEWLNPDTGVWRQAVSGSWQGGTKDKAGNPKLPSMTVTLANYLGKELRVWVDLPRVVNLGVDRSFR